MCVGDDEIQRNLIALRDGSHDSKILARANLACIFECRGMVYEAIELLETNARLGAQTPELYGSLVRLYRAIGNADAAAHAANEAAHFGPEWQRSAPRVH